MIVFGGLKLKQGSDAEGAEKLLKENLIPAATGIEGLKMKILKRVKMPNEQPDQSTFDYIIMAEMDNPQNLMQLQQSKSTELNKFGEMMKEYAGHPYINAYTIIGRTDAAKSQ